MPTVRTARLSLIPLTPALGVADIAGRASLERALGATVPENWPPELFEVDKLEWTIRHLEQNPREIGWWLHYVIFRAENMLVGVAGYKGRPDANGLVEIGYSILSEFRRRGIATEATLGLADHAFAQRAVDCVIAQTMPTFKASRMVLEKAGFRFAGPGAEPDAICYELPREAWAIANARRRKRTSPAGVIGRRADDVS
ncbi:MAG: GNAT family N-acetyltransferase [Gammaproteobacteria bacterium]